MANDSGHGGARTPSKPAGVSGPGALSQRTDGGPKIATLPNAEYGEQASFATDQRGASMGTPSPAGSPRAGGGGAPPAGFGGPSGRPEEPVTAGAALGPGIGPEALGLDEAAMKSDDLEKIRPYLPVLIFQANRPESTQAFRNYVRYVRTQLR